MLKVLQRILRNRNKNKCEQDLEETQFGFTNNLGQNVEKYHTSGTS